MQNQSARKSIPNSKKRKSRLFIKKFQKLKNENFSIRILRIFLHKSKQNKMKLTKRKFYCIIFNKVLTWLNVKAPQIIKSDKKGINSLKKDLESNVKINKKFNRKL